MMDRETSIFLDTNIIQTFIDSKKGSGSNVFLYKLGIRQDYYKLSDFIKENGLEDRIEICIPEVVVMEMKHHMKEGFKKQFQRMKEQIEENQRIFGNLADFSAIEVKHNKESYDDYVDSLFLDFFSTTKNYAKQIPFPRQDPILDTLVSKAISGTRPFFTGKIESKYHTDAGFKDSVIAETIYEYSKKYNKLCIFITNDRDFSSKFSDTIQADSKLVLFTTIEMAIKALAEYYGTDPQIRLLREFTENTYWHEYLLNESGIEFDESVTKCKVEDVSNYEGEIFIIKMSFVVNEAEYLFSIKFDSNANDILDFNCQIMND